MTIFKSRQVNLDPEPWVAEFGTDRYILPDDTSKATVYDPRPEFEPTRDPWPYTHTGGSRHAFPGTLDGERLVWAPRREQFDTPVNRVLGEFRECDGDPVAWLLWLDQTPISQMGVDPTPEEVDHARRVLTRLANWKEQANG